MIYLNVERHLVHVGFHRLPREVAPKEFELLRILAEADGRYVAREDLLERVWKLDRAIELDTRTVDQHVARLRRNLGREGRESIVTVVGYGYKGVHIRLEDPPVTVRILEQARVRRGVSYQTEARVVFDRELPRLRARQEYEIILRPKKAVAA